MRVLVQYYYFLNITMSVSYPILLKKNLNMSFPLQSLSTTATPPVPSNSLALFSFLPFYLPVPFGPKIMSSENIYNESRIGKANEHSRIDSVI